MVLFVFVRGHEQSSLYWNGGYPADCSNKERHRKLKTNRYKLLTRMNCNKFRIFLEKNK